MEMDDGPSGIALSSGSSDVDMADVASVASSGGQGRDAPSVFSVDDEARSALVTSTTLAALPFVLLLLALLLGWPLLMAFLDCKTGCAMP
jgi:hypothetical protein